MSGPIVRKYGFPNFEQIFGKRELEHGVEGKKPVDPLQRDSETNSEKSQNPAETDKSGEAKAKP